MEGNDVVSNFASRKSSPDPAAAQQFTIQHNKQG